MHNRPFSALLAALALGACTDQGPLAPPVLGPSLAVSTHGTDLGAIWSSDPNVGEHHIHRSNAEDINRYGVTVGWNSTPNVALRWESGGPLQDVNTVPYGSRSLALNDAGVMAGYALTGTYEAYRQAPGGQMVGLGVLMSAGDSYGADINNLDVVTGHASVMVGPFRHSRAFRTAPGGPMVDLGVPVGVTEDGSSVGLAINDAGTVVGYYACRGCQGWAIRAVVGQSMELLAVPQNSSAEDINDVDEIIGNYYAPDSLPAQRSYFREADGTVRRLPTLDGKAVWAYGMNDHGDVVGAMGAGDTHAVLWPAGGGVVDLGPGVAKAINNGGEIVGYGPAADGHEHAMRWTVTAVSAPTPPAAPAAVMLSATAVGVSWIDTSNDETGFEVARRIRNADGSWSGYTARPSLPAGASAMTDEGLESSRTYQYRIRACNAAACSAWALSPSAVLAVPPAAPTAPVGNIVSATRIQVRWTDGSANETRFELSRRMRNVDGSWTSYAVLPHPPRNATGAADTTVQTTQVYQYRLRACNEAGCSPWVLGSSVMVPTAPETLTTTPSTATRINLHWEDRSTNEERFEVARRTRQDGIWSSYVALAPRAPNVEGFADTTLSPATTYQYRVRACNASGCSPWLLGSVALTPAS